VLIQQFLDQIESEEAIEIDQIQKDIEKLG